MTLSDVTPFSDMLRQFRRAAALSQEALADRAGLSPDAVRALERGRRTAPRPDTVTALATALGLTPDKRAALVTAATGDLPPTPSAAAASSPTSSAAAASSPASSAAAVQTAPLPPAPPTRLIGREHDEATVRDIIRDGARLLTLTGPGGVGKTRLAIAVAAALQQDYGDGVAFVDLSPLRDPALVPTTIARALGLRSAAQDARDALIPYLRPRHLLLVLDNVEQVAEAAPLLAELLACPGLAMLVTSRVPLRLRAERLFWVSPLAMPSLSAQLQVEQVARAAAVQLFVACAQAVQPDFSLDDANAEPIARICARLDGLPLALELAANWIRLLPPRALLARLERRLMLLESGPRDLPARQRTLRDTIAWSFDLLAGPAQRLFARLAVFQGGRSLEAIEAVCNPDGALDILDEVETLTHANLLRRERDAEGEPRFTMFETIHEYAHERLRAADEEAMLCRRHAGYFLSFAERAEPELSGSAAGLYHARLELEHDNLRVALQWAIEAGEAETGLRLASSLWKFWQTCGYLTEGRGWFDRLLAMPQARAVTPPLRARAMARAGWLAHRQDDFARAAALLEESVAVHRAALGESGIADILVNRGLVAHAQGDYARATALLEEALALHRAAEDRAGIGGVLWRLGIVTRERGDYARATALYEECLALHQQLGDRENAAIAYLGLSDIARDTGQHTRVEEMCRQSLAIFEAIGERWGTGCTLHNLGVAAAQRGDFPNAIALIEESLDIFREMAIGGSVAEALVSLGRVWRLSGDLARAHALVTEGLRIAEVKGPRWLVAAAQEELAILAVAEDRHADAARYLDSAMALHASMGAPVWPAHRIEYERALAAIASNPGL